MKISLLKRPSHTPGIMIAKKQDSIFCENCKDNLIKRGQFLWHQYHIICRCDTWGIPYILRICDPSELRTLIYDLENLGYVVTHEWSPIYAIVKPNKNHGIYCAEKSR